MSNIDVVVELLAFWDTHKASIQFNYIIFSMFYSFRYWLMLQLWHWLNDSWQMQPLSRIESNENAIDFNSGNVQLENNYVEDDQWVIGMNQSAANWLAFSIGAHSVHLSLLLPSIFGQRNQRLFPSFFSLRNWWVR